jgi:hypothetical protein
VSFVEFTFVVGGRGHRNGEQRAPEGQRQDASYQGMKAVHGQTMTDRT